MTSNHPGCNGTRHQPGCGHPGAPHGAIGGTDLLDAGMDAPRDLADQTPVEIDTQLSEIYYELASERQRRDSDYDFLAGEIGRDLGRGWRGTATKDEVAAVLAEIDEMPASERTFQQKDRLKSWEKIEDRQAKIDDLIMSMEPFEAEYRRRPWPRAFLVTNVGGHVHRDMNCHTCRDTTQYHWVTDYSGKDESEIVEAAGERACTSCYPSAPVEVLNRPTKMFTPDEVKAAKAREERAAAKVARDAAKIAKALTPDGSEFVIQRGQWKERFKTETAAMQWAVSSYIDVRMRPDVWLEEKGPGIEKIVDAVAAKHDRPRDEVMAELVKKARAKAKRDGWDNWDQI